MAGPTRNAEYNAVLASWKEQGAPSDPQCEECGCDLTGKEVVEITIGWYCETCAETYDGDVTGGEWPHDREDFHSDG